MGKSQRTKGAAFEREVAHLFEQALGEDFHRNIGQARDGGNDLDIGPLVIECKRRKTLGTVYSWLQQAIDAIPAFRRKHQLPPEALAIPVVVAREDNGTHIAILRLHDFVALTRDVLQDEIHTRAFGPGTAKALRASVKEGA